MEAAVKSAIKGYREISLAELQTELKRLYKKSGKSYIDLAIEMKVRSTSTIQNLLSSKEQIVSDEMLTNFINLFGLKAFIVWQYGERNYYIKN